MLVRLDDPKVPLSPHTLGPSAYETRFPLPGFLRVRASRRSRPYRYRGSRSGNRRAVPPFRNVSVGTTSERHFAGIGLNPMAARFARRTISATDEVPQIKSVECTMSESSSPNTLNDQTLLDHYTRFQGERRSLGAIYPFPLRDDFLDRGSYQGIAWPVVMMAQEEILAITINLRRFWYDLHSINAWSKVFELVTEAEKWQAIYEFVFPIISLSLFAPYSIKQMVVKSIYRHFV